MRENLGAWMSMCLMVLLAAGWLGCAAPEEPVTEEAAQPGEDMGEDDEAAIRALAESWDPLSNAGDADGMANLFASDAILLHEKLPVVVGRQAIRDAFAALYGAQSVDESNPVEEIQVAEGWAFARGRFEGTTTPEGGEAIEAIGKWVSVLRKTDEGWKYYIDIWNRDAAVTTTVPEITGSPVEDSVMGSEADVEAIRELMTSWDAALNGGHVDAIVGLYTADARRMPMNRPVEVGVDAIRAAFEKEFAEASFEEEGPVHGIDVAGDWAYAWGTWSNTVTDASDGGTTDNAGKWLEILRRTPEGWKIYIEIWNAS